MAQKSYYPIYAVLMWLFTGSATVTYVQQETEIINLYLSVTDAVQMNAISE